MNILIIEDEAEAADRLKRLLSQYDQKIQVLAAIESVEDAIDWFRNNPAPDLICLDIHLADGLCFDIFQEVRPKAPIIFTTAYDQYAIRAFKLDSIDYLLKPVESEELFKALDKHQDRQLKNLISPDYQKIAELLRPKQYKNRFIARSGQKDILIDSSDVAYILAEEKNVFLIDRKNNKYALSATLENLENLLDPDSFLRINRSEIVHLDAIEFIEPYFNSREIVSLNIPSHPKLIVSRRRVKELKDRIGRIK